MARAASGSGEIPKHGYVSEFTRFINGFLEEHPEVVVDQSRGRAIYWDKDVNLEDLEKAQEDSVPVEGYYYFGSELKRGDTVK